MKSLVARINRVWKLFAALVIVVLRSREHRRKLMFFVSLLAMFIAFFGIVALDEFLTERVGLFLCYWAFCAVLILLMLLLSIYDMIRIRIEMTGEALLRLEDIDPEVEIAGSEERAEEGSDEPVGKKGIPGE